MDILPYYDNESQTGGWSIANGDVTTGSSLQAAVMVSLLTDRVAEKDWSGSAGQTDRHGWWGDDYSDYPIGSRLWQLRRGKKIGSSETLLKAKDICREALQWLLTEEIAAKIEIDASWRSASGMIIVIMITEPSGTSTTFQYAWAWDEL